jgi:acetoin utilization protein AcuA
MASAFGPLEQRVMDTLWDRSDPASVRDLQPGFSQVAYTTLMTTLDRLHRKGLLDRVKHGRAFFYHPRLGRAEYQSTLAADALRVALDGGHGSLRPLLSFFVDAVGEREHQLLLSLAQKPENRLTLAYTAAGKIIGQATLAPLDDWWQGIGHAYEIAVEVSPRWRKLGIAHKLLSFALEFESLEEYLIVGLGLSWHWDYEGLGIPPYHYREMIARLFAAHGFVEYLTSEPNIRMDPANILVARLGSRLDDENMNRFFQRLLQSETLPGL